MICANPPIQHQAINSPFWLICLVNMITFLTKSLLPENANATLNTVRWFFAIVYLNMQFKISNSCERHVTMVTFIWFLACVTLHMLSVMPIAVREALETHLTFILHQMCYKIRFIWNTDTRLTLLVCNSPHVHYYISNYILIFRECHVFYLHMVCKIGSPYTTNVTLDVFIHTTSISLGKLAQVIFISIIAPSVSSYKLYFMKYDRTRINHILYIITAYIFLTTLHTIYSDWFKILSDNTAYYWTIHIFLSGL